MPNTIPAESFDLEGLELPAAGVVAPLASEPVKAPEEAAPEKELETEEPPETTLEEGMEKEQAASAEKVEADKEEAAAKKIDAETKAAEEAAAKKVEAEKVKDADPNADRDKDLTPPADATAHMRPTTRKVIDDFKKKAAEARNERDNIRRETEELKKQLAEAKTRTAPKEVEDELKTLRERVRELDITKDPQIEAKYDKPVIANHERILETLKAFGFGQTSDGKPDTAAIEDLRKAGFSFKTLKSSIDKLESIGAIDEAESIRESLRQNSRLAQEKQSEIAKWKTDFDSRTQSRTAEQQKAAEETQTRVRTAASRIISDDVAEMSKTLPNLVRPQPADPKDPPATAAARQRQIEEYDASNAKVQEALKLFDTAGLPPDKAAEAQGRLGATAVKGLLLTHHVLPKLQASLAAQEARVKELEAELGKVRKAGSVSRAHAISASAPAKDAKELPSDPVEAMKAFARERGLSEAAINT